MLALFDFPPPVSTSEQRMRTNVPPQRLFLMNSPFVEEQAKALGERASTGDESAKIRHAYRLVYGRDPEADGIEARTRFPARGGLDAVCARVA